jgi:hypothetical protein
MDCLCTALSSTSQGTKADGNLAENATICLGVLFLTAIINNQCTVASTFNTLVRRSNGSIMVMSARNVRHNRAYYEIRNNLGKLPN